MKRTIGVLAILFLFSIAQAQPGSFLDRTKLALKAGNAKELSALFASTLQVGFDGEADVISSKEAEIRIGKFYKSLSPLQLESLFQGLSKDGKQYFIGKLGTKTSTYRISVYWVESPSPAIQSIDFSKE